MDGSFVNISFFPFQRQMTYLTQNKFPFIIFPVSLKKGCNSKGVISVLHLLYFYQLAENLSDFSPYF